MSEGFQEFLKWIIIGIIIISVYNQVTNKTPNGRFGVENLTPRAYKTTIIIGEQGTTAFRSW